MDKPTKAGWYFDTDSVLWSGPYPTQEVAWNATLSAKSGLPLQGARVFFYSPNGYEESQDNTKLREALELISDGDYDSIPCLSARLGEMTYECDVNKQCLLCRVRRSLAST